jgi:hypothetical protein
MQVKELHHPEKKSEIDELRRLLNWWGNSTTTMRGVYIISKNDYALLSYTWDIFIENRMGICRSMQIEEKFAKAGEKYKQVLHKACQLRFVNGTAFGNDKGIYTYRIKRPLSNAPPLSIAKKYVNIVGHPPVGYEIFCTRVNKPDEQMLEEWSIFVRGK